MIKIVYIFLFLPLLGFSQHDTVKLFTLIPASDEFYAHKKFWNYIHDRDQEIRKSSSIEKIDEENLILVCEYFNRFGYPDVRKFDHAKVVQGVWGHNRYSKVNQYTFPIILAGYNAGAIPESAYREFYLRYMYQLKFDGQDYKTKSISYLHDHLGIEAREYLSLDTIINLLIEFRQIRNDTQSVMGRWYAIIPSDTFYFEGKQLIKKGESHKVILYETSNGTHYLLQESDGNALEPIRLAQHAQQKEKFTVVGKESSNYYLITDDKILLYMNKYGDILKSYETCR